MNRGNLRGYSYAFGASFALAASFIFSKAALNLIDMIHFGFIWFGFGMILNFAWMIFRKGFRFTSGMRRPTLITALIIAIVEGAATGLFYVAIQKMENPAVVSFIGNLGPVLVTLMGITLLREKYSLLQLFGILLTLAGVFALSFNRGTELSSFFQPGAIYVLLAAVLFSGATIFARWKREDLDPELMSSIRSALLFVFFGILLTGNGFDRAIPSGVWLYLLAGSFLETLITIVFAYQALRYIEAARTSLIISLKGLWVLAGAFLFLDVFPQNYELIGGMASLTGVILLSLPGRRSKI